MEIDRDLERAARHEHPLLPYSVWARDDHRDTALRSTTRAVPRRGVADFRGTEEAAPLNGRSSRPAGFLQHK